MCVYINIYGVTAVGATAASGKAARATTTDDRLCNCFSPESYCSHRDIANVAGINNTLQKVYTNGEEPLSRSFKGQCAWRAQEPVEIGQPKCQALHLRIRMLLQRTLNYKNAATQSARHGDRNETMFLGDRTKVRTKTPNPVS